MATGKNFLIFLFLTLVLDAKGQNWIPRLNKNDTYSLVNEKGKLVTNEQYDNIGPMWDGEPNSSWQTKGRNGCVFRNKTSIEFEPNKRLTKNVGNWVKPVAESGQKALNDYAYLVEFSKHNLLVNLRTGKYIQDEINRDESYAYKSMPSFPVRYGLMKIHKNGNWVNFVDLNFKEYLPRPIRNGEMVNHDLFIAQDSATGLFGLVDAAGNVKVPYSWEKMALSSVENHIIVGANMQKNARYASYRYGILNADGKLVLDTVYNEIKIFAKKFYIVRTEYKSAVLNQYLEPVVPLAQQKIEQVNDYFPEKSKYLFILNHQREQNFMVMDSTGNFALKAHGDDFDLQFECAYFVLKNGKERIVYRAGEGIQLVIRDTFDNIYCTTSAKDTFYLMGKAGGIQLVSSKGDRLKSYPCDALVRLKSIDGAYQAIKGEKSGIIAASGEVLAPFEYDDVFNVEVKGKPRYFTGFKTGNEYKYGVYDKNLKKWTMFTTREDAAAFLYPPEFRIVAGKNNLFKVLRMNGAQVIPEQYQIIKQMKDWPVFACYDPATQKWSIINENNRVIFTFNDVGDRTWPVAELLRSTGDYAVTHGMGTLYLKKDTFEKLSYFDLLYVDTICVASLERKGWVTMFKSGRGKNQAWANYYTGKVYIEE